MKYRFFTLLALQTVRFSGNCITGVTVGEKQKYNHAGGQIYNREGTQPPKAQHTGQNDPAKPSPLAQRPLVQTQLRAGK